MGDGDQAGGAGSVSEAGSGWHGSGVCWVTIQGWAGGWAGLGLGSGLGWVLFSILIHHSQLPNKPYLSRPRGGGWSQSCGSYCRQGVS